MTHSRKRDPNTTRVFSQPPSTIEDKADHKSVEGARLPHLAKILLEEHSHLSKRKTVRDYKRQP